MEGFFDIRTLSFCTGLLTLMLSACMAYVCATRKTYSGFCQWTAAAFFGFAGMLLLSCRGHLPDVITIILANLLLLLQFVLLHAGLRRYIGLSHAWNTDSVLLAIQLIGSVYFTYLTSSVAARIHLVSALVFILQTRCLLLTYKRVPQLQQDRNGLLLAAFSVGAIWQFFRIGLTATHEGHIHDYMAPSLIQGANVAVYGFVAFSTYVGLLVLNSQRVEYDLSTSLSEIKVLKGLLPVCCSCKRIRDEEGSWEQLEAYIRQHSEADFTHSICPECSQKLYGDMPQG